jgi:small conductance mechanosensitive channel
MAAPALPPVTLPSAVAMPATVKAALPALTIMLVNGALALLAGSLILIAGWTLSRWLGRWLRDLLNRSTYVDETLKPLIANFAAYGVMAVTIVSVLSQFGVQTTSLIALLGAAGLAVGLALQGTLSNVASGVMLLVLRPFRVAENISVSDRSGTVREVGLFRTALVTDDGLFVSIPNSTIFSGTIVNTSRETARRTGFTVDIDHQEDIAKARKTILDMLMADPRVLKTPKPDVQVDAIGGNSNTLSVQAWLQNKDFGGQQSALKAKVRRALADRGISPPIPIPAPSVAPWSPEPAPEPLGQGKSKPN